MGEQIIKQPGGLYAVYSSITRTIHVYDATRAEILDHFADQAAADARRIVESKLEHIDNDDPRSAYYQFALTWDEALEMDRTHGGDAWRDCLPLDIDIP